MLAGSSHSNFTEEIDMSYIHGAVYEPPVSGTGLPLVAIVFGPDGEVVTARAVPSVQIGEALIADALKAAYPGKG